MYMTSRVSSLIVSIGGAVLILSTSSSLPAAAPIAGAPQDLNVVSCPTFGGSFIAPQGWARQFEDSGLVMTAWAPRDADPKTNGLRVTVAPARGRTIYDEAAVADKQLN